jgi:hypothetical protein
MKIVVPAVAAAFLATVGAGSAAQAALINFGVSAISGNDLSYTTGSSLDMSTAFDFGASPLAVTSTGPGDASGLTTLKFPPTSNMFVTLTPTDIDYGTGTLGAPVVKSWTGGNGDSFVETLTKVEEIDRGTPDAITVTLEGTVTDSLGLFHGSPVEFIMQANQVKGPGTAIVANFTNSTITIPEPSTWVMLALGFAGLGYAAVRRSAKDRSALAI